MSKSKKRTVGNPAKQSENPVIAATYRRLLNGVQLTKDLQDHIIPNGDGLITQEQWEYLRGSVICDMAIYAQLTEKPSPIGIIVASEQQRVSIEF